MLIHHATEGLAGVLPVRALGKQVIVLSDEYSSERGSAIEKISIANRARRVLKSGEHIHVA